MADLCDDGRFELIEKYKLMLMKSTNISDSEDELKVLDTILFRFWQMGWLDKLEQPTAQQWIPCSERLPEEGKDVLCCFYNGEYYRIIVSHRTDFNFWSGVGRTGDLIAWMPLPEPWKGEQL